jgi:hypothetical protein
VLKRATAGTNAQFARSRTDLAAAATVAIVQESIDGGTVDRHNALTGGRFPGLIGFRVVEVHDDGLSARLEVRPDLLGPPMATCTPPPSSASPTPPAASAPG